MDKKSGIIVLIIFGLTILSVFGNITVKQGGLMDNALLNDNNPVAESEKKLALLRKAGLETSDGALFTIVINDDLSGSLERIAQFCAKLKEAFPENAVISLSTVPMYRDNGSELLTEPYITPDLILSLRSSEKNQEEWKREAIRDGNVFGSLVSKDFKHAIVFLLLREGFDEIESFKKITAFMEQREIGKWEWLFKRDIEPAKEFEGITVAGWAVARGLMNAALVSEILNKFVFFGIPLAFFGLWLFLRSFWQACIAVFIIVISFAWTRGTLGALQYFDVRFFGLELYERVYILLVCASLLVSGFSFTERRFAAYNDKRKKNTDRTKKDCWKKSGSINGKIALTGAISIANFVTLYQIGVRGILEVGILAAIGIAYQLALAIWAVPALHLCVSRFTDAETKAVRREGTDKNFAEKWIDRLLVRISRLVLDGDKNARSTRLLLMSVSLCLFVVTMSGALIMLGKLTVKTNPLEYLKDTLVHKAGALLNRPEGYGFERLTVALEPASGNIYDPDYLREVGIYCERLKAIRSNNGGLIIRETNSIIDTLRVLSRESYKKPLPETAQEIHDGLFLIGEGLPEYAKEQFWCNAGMVVFASFPADDSSVMGDLVRGAKHAAQGLNSFTATAFGKVVSYPEIDLRIVGGKPLNTFTSLPLVGIMSAFWFWWRQRNSVKPAYRVSPIRIGGALCIPFVFAYGVVALIMIALKVPLDQATACITSLSVNAAADFSLYLGADFQDALNKGSSPKQALEFAIKEKGEPTVVDILTNMLCFLPLAFSVFLPIARLGWIMGVMLLACGLGALVLFTALLPWCVVQNKK